MARATYKVLKDEHGNLVRDEAGELIVICVSGEDSVGHARPRERFGSSSLAEMRARGVVPTSEFDQPGGLWEREAAKRAAFLAGKPVLSVAEREARREAIRDAYEKCAHGKGVVSGGRFRKQDD